MTAADIVITHHCVDRVRSRFGDRIDAQLDQDSAMALVREMLAQALKDGSKRLNGKPGRGEVAVQHLGVTYILAPHSAQPTRMALVTVMPKHFRTGQHNTMGCKAKRAHVPRHQREDDYDRR